MHGPVNGIQMYIFEHSLLLPAEAAEVASEAQVAWCVWGNCVASLVNVE